MSTVGVISLGCSKNRVDSERILGCFADAGFTITPNPEEAEVLLVNTCGFITPAKEESINTTLEMAQYKQTGRCKLLVMAGCLSQRYPGELEAEMPEVDLFWGVSRNCWYGVCVRCWGFQRTARCMEAGFLLRLLTVPTCASRMDATTGALIAQSR